MRKELRGTRRFRQAIQNFLKIHIAFQKTLSMFAPCTTSTFPKKTSLVLSEDNTTAEVVQFETRWDAAAKFDLAEHGAWGLVLHRNSDPHSLFACTGGDLLDKLETLESSIV